MSIFQFGDAAQTEQAIGYRVIVGNPELRQLTRLPGYRCFVDVQWQDARTAVVRFNVASDDDPDAFRSLLPLSAEDESESDEEDYDDEPTSDGE